MVSNYNLSILKNKLDRGFRGIEKWAKETSDVIDYIVRNGRITYYSDNLRRWKNDEYKFYCIYNEIKGYYGVKFNIYKDYINPIIIDLLVLWKNSKTKKHKLNQKEDEKETTSNKLLRRN